MSKQQHRPAPSLSPAARIAECEKIIASLEAKHLAAVERAAEYAKAREALAFRAHALVDPEAGKELSEARDNALSAEREATEILAAIATAKMRLTEAEAAQARQQRRDAIKQEQQRSQEFRQLGPYLDKHVDALRRGLQALSENARHVHRDHHHVRTLHRCLQVALADTVFKDFFGVADYPTRQSFASFDCVIGQWCDSNDANLANELAMLENGDQTTKAA
jgi:hypothetical protein